METPQVASDKERVGGDHHGLAASQGHDPAAVSGQHMMGEKETCSPGSSAKGADAQGADVVAFSSLGNPLATTANSQGQPQSGAPKASSSKGRGAYRITRVSSVSSPPTTAAAPDAWAQVLFCTVEGWRCSTRCLLPFPYTPYCLWCKGQLIMLAVAIRCCSSSSTVLILVHPFFTSGRDIPHAVDVGRSMARIIAAVCGRIDSHRTAKLQQCVSVRCALQCY